jgi:hypothetical protein
MDCFASLAMTGMRPPSTGRHTPRRRGFQYAAASRFNHCCYGCYGDSTVTVIGIGSDDYRRLFCKGDEPIFGSFVALSLRGKLAAGAMSGLNRARRMVKRNPALFEMAQRLRSALS